MIEGATERKWEYQNPTGSLNAKRFESISLPGIMTRRSDAGIVPFEKISSREPELNFAQKKKLVTNAKVTNYETKWDIVSEKITKDVVFVPDTMRQRRLVSPEGPKNSKLSELRRHEVLAPPPVVAKSPVNIEI